MYYTHDSINRSLRLEGNYICKFGKVTKIITSIIMDNYKIKYEYVLLGVNGGKIIDYTLK